MDKTATTVTKTKRDKKRLFYDIVFICGFCSSLIPGPMPSLSSMASLLLLGCIAVSFFDENFYLYMAIFIYLRYRLFFNISHLYLHLSSPILPALASFFEISGLHHCHQSSSSLALPN